MTTNLQRKAFDLDVRYALRNDLRSARALLTHGPKAFAAPERFLRYAIRREDADAVALLINLGAPVARTLRKVTMIPGDCMTVMLKHTTPAMLNATDGYFYPLWLAAHDNAFNVDMTGEGSGNDRYAKGFAQVLDWFEAAGADVTWAGLGRAFEDEGDVEWFRLHLAEAVEGPIERTRRAVVAARLARNSLAHPLLGGMTSEEVREALKGLPTSEGIWQALARQAVAGQASR